MELLEKIKNKFGSKIDDVKIVNDRRVYIDIPFDYIRDASYFLFNRMRMRFITASGIDEKDFMEILYHFSSDPKGEIISLRVKLDSKNPEIDTISDLIKGAKWIEREMRELLGIGFNGNEDTRNLLLSPNYKGPKNPLKKDGK